VIIAMSLSLYKACSFSLDPSSDDLPSLIVPHVFLSVNPSITGESPTYYLLSSHLPPPLDYEKKTVLLSLSNE